MRRFFTKLDHESFFHSSCGRASHFSLLVQREVTQRNTGTRHTPFPPMTEPLGIGLGLGGGAKDCGLCGRCTEHCQLCFGSCFCGMDAANGGPCGAASGRRKARRVARRTRASSLCVQDAHSANPVARSRTRRAGCPESATPGGVSLGYFSLHKQRKVTRSLQASGSS